MDMGMRYEKEMSVREEWPFKAHPFPKIADLRHTLAFVSNYALQTSTSITKYFLIELS